MKSVSAESPKQLSAAPESAEIYDFLYVDRARISVLYAQLFPQGILTTVKTTAEQSFSDDNNIGTDVKLFKAEAKSAEGGSEGIERMFDASWSIPLEVLSALRSRSLVLDSMKEANLGSIILMDCHLRIIDFASMDGLWEPALKIYIATAKPELPAMMDEILAVLKAMPKVIHAHFLTSEAFLWSSLQPTGLTIPTDDLTLKHGGVVSGGWKALYVLDTWADGGKPPDVDLWSGGDLTNGVLTAMHGLRTLLGRPSTWIGVTPLMIYRNVSGTLRDTVAKS
jgi:hypothetical protein